MLWLLIILGPEPEPSYHQDNTGVWLDANQYHNTTYKQCNATVSPCISHLLYSRNFVESGLFAEFNKAIKLYTPIMLQRMNVTVYAIG